ncbi:MAG TPA: MFS transporter [Beijerinckiaceae bacterium]|nr:MFS transporter [Beijerinckiaceae bacterium]
MALPLVPLLGLAAVAVSYNQRMLDPLTVLIARDLAVDVTRTIALSPAFTLPYALGQPFLGPVADSFGKALVLKLCMAVIAITTLAAMFVSDDRLLLALRFVTGLAAGGIIPTCLALIADRTPMAERQLTLSRFMVAIIVGQLFTAPVSAALAEAFGWRASPLVAIALASLSMLLLLRGLVPRRDAIRPPFSPRRAVALYRQILGLPRARACYVAVAAEGLFVFGFIPHIAVYLSDRGLGGATEAGYILAGMGLGGLVHVLIVRWLVRRFDPFTLMIAGSAMLAVGLVSFALANSWPLMMLSFVILGNGFYLLHTGLQTQVTEILPEARASLVSLHAFWLFVGIAAGPILFGWGMALFGVRATLIASGIAMGLVGTLASRVLRRQVRAFSSEVDAGSR